MIPGVARPPVRTPAPASRRWPVGNDAKEYIEPRRYGDEQKSEHDDEDRCGHRGAAAFLHFHEDPAGLFADVKVGGAFERHRVSTAVEQDDLLAVVRRALG